MPSIQAPVTWTTVSHANKALWHGARCCCFWVEDISNIWNNLTWHGSLNNDYCPSETKARVAWCCCTIRKRAMVVQPLGFGHRWPLFKCYFKHWHFNVVNWVLSHLLPVFSPRSPRSPFSPLNPRSPRSPEDKTGQTNWKVTQTLTGPTINIKIQQKY